MNDYSGCRFGRLTAIEPAGRDKWRNVLWRCMCDCGNVSIVRSNDLRRTKSCGCLHSEVTAKRCTTHGKSHVKLYKVWAGIKQRCCNPRNCRYADYGGRGISLCDEWMGYESFAAWAERSNYEDGLDIDRIDNNGGYNPNNCRFVPRVINCRNKRDNVFLDLGGDRKTIAEWAETTGLSPNTIQKRLCMGWSARDAILLPSGTRRGRSDG